MKKFFSLLALILLMVGFEAQAKDVYAVVNGKRMTIKYLDSKPSGAYTVDEWTAHNASTFVPDLHATLQDVIETIVIDGSMTDAKPTSTKCWFSNFVAIKEIENLPNLNTSAVTNMDHMFARCGLLETIDLSGFNTENVKDFSCMFFHCTSLKALDLSTFTTANATSLFSMFNTCSKLKSLNLAHFNTAKVTNMEYTFKNCASLEEVNLRNFSTDKVTSTQEMFNGCSQLRTIYCMNDWTNVSYSGDMFKGCAALVGGKDSKCDGENDINGTCALVDGVGDKKGYFTAVKEVYTEFADGVLTYKCDDQRLYSDKKTEVYDNPETPRFSGYNKDVTSAVIDPSMKDTNLISTRKMFYGTGTNQLANMTTISGLENLNTENVTDMAYMFYECMALESLDLRGFNTAKATTIACMFDGCHALKELDLRSFNTANVTIFNYMFNDCKALEKVDLSSFNTEKASNMTFMFANCQSLKELDLSGFDTKKVTVMSSMFNGCTALEKLDLSGFDITNVTTMEKAFNGCSSLKTIYCSGDWRSSTATATGLFTGCTALEGGKNTKYDANKVKKEYACWDGLGGDPGYFTPAKAVYVEFDNSTKVMTYRYDNNCYYSTKTVELYDPDASASFSGFADQVEKAVIDPSMAEAKLKSMAHMFCGTAYDFFTNMTEIEGMENLNTENATSMKNMFYGCTALKAINLSAIKTSKVTDMRNLFNLCENLETLDLSGFDTRKVTDMSYMFLKCKKLKSLDLSGFNTASLKNMWKMFSGCSELTELDLSSFYTIYVTSLYATFQDCAKLEKVDLSSFHTANVTSMETMFQNCASLKEVNLNSFNMDKVTSTKDMFNGCVALESIYCNDIWPKPTTSTNMFKGCKALVGGNETAYSDSYIDITYARLDGLGNLPGYFTATAEVYTEYEDGVLTYRYDDQRHKSYKTVEKYDPNALRFEGYRSDIIKAVIDPSMKDANLTTTSAMFNGMYGYLGYGLDKLETIEGLENLNTEKVLDMTFMFMEAAELTELDMSHFNTAKVTSMSYMFNACERLKTVDISSFQMDNVVYANSMFGNCTRLATIYHNSDWTKSDMTADYMFSGCKRLVGRSGTKYDGSKPIDNTYARLDGGKKNPGYFTGVYRVTLEAENGSANVNESGVNLNHVLEGTKLTFSATPNEGYEFDGWTNYNSGSSLTVTDNVTVTANFKLQTFTVTFYDWNNTVLKTETVEYGKAATAPENPVREGYEFTGWDTDFSNVKSDLKVYAQYKSAQGIEDVQSDNVQCTKVLRNGQIYILIGEKMYDVTGRMIQ